MKHMIALVSLIAVSSGVLPHVAQAQALINARPLRVFSSGTPVNSITLQGPTTYSSVYTLTMPASAPALNQLLISDGSGNLSWGLIGMNNLGNGTVTLPKLSSSGATPGQVIGFDGTNIVWTASGGAPSGAAGGDLSGSYPNPDIAAGAIVNADINAAAAIAYSKLNLTNSIQNGDIVANAITTSKVANGTVTTSKLADSAVSGLKLLTNAVQTNHIADGAVGLSKISTTGATSGDVLTYNGSSVVWGSAGGTVSRNATLVGDGSAGSPLGINLGNSNTWTANQTFAGTFLITSNSRIAMTNSDNNARDIRFQEPSGTGSQYIGWRAPSVSNNGNYVYPAVVGSVGQVLTIATSNGIDSATTQWSTLGGGSPTGAAGGDLTGTYPNPDIAAGVIVNADINASAAIAYSKLSLTNSIQNGDIVANAITTSKVANGTVTASKMADSAVSGLKLLTAAVNTAHIADAAITAAKMSGTGASHRQTLVFNASTNDVSWGYYRIKHKRVAISNINSPYNTASDDEIIGVDVTAGPVTINLPSANSLLAGTVIIIKNELGNASVNNVTIQRSGTDLINASSTSITINSGTGTGSFRLYTDGVSRWHQY